MLRALANTRSYCVQMRSQRAAGLSPLRSMQPFLPNCSNVKCAASDSNNDWQSKRKVLPGGLQRISIATWNSNGLLGKEAATSRKKATHLKSLLGNYDVVAVLELHGDYHASKRLKQKHLRHSHFVKFSVGPSYATMALLTGTDRQQT